MSYLKHCLKTESIFLAIEKNERNGLFTNNELKKWKNELNPSLLSFNNWLILLHSIIIVFEILVPHLRISKKVLIYCSKFGFLYSKWITEVLSKILTPLAGDHWRGLKNAFYNLKLYAGWFTFHWRDSDILPRGL